MTARLGRSALVTPRHECGYVGTPTSPGRVAYSLRQHSCARHLEAAAATARNSARHSSIDRTPKQCGHKRADHQCGTYAKYTLDGCRCLPCCGAVAEYERERLRRHAYGRWDNLVDAAPAREHVRELMAAGLGLKRIAALSSVNLSNVSDLVYGKKRTDGQLRQLQRLKTANADALLAVQATPDLLAGGVAIDGTGTRRRVQALLAVGWSMSKMAERLGMAPSNFPRLVEELMVLASTARAVTALYDELWNQPPPETNQRERISASRSRNLARRRGYLPPLAWDDDSIDDPAARADATAIASRPDGRRALPPVEDLQFLLDAGESISTIASRFHVSEGAVVKVLRAAARTQEAPAA